MKRAMALIPVVILVGLTSWAQAAEPLKAVVYVGGCCHDYKTMPGVLAGKMSGLVNVNFDIKPMDSRGADGGGV